MASLGIRRFEDLIGRADLLEMDDAIEHWKSRDVDLLDGSRDARPAPRHRPPSYARRRCRSSTTRSTGRSSAAARRRIERGEPVALGPILVRNVNRAVGASCQARSPAGMAGRGSRRARSRSRFPGSAGQSFGAWLAPGVTLPARGGDERLRGQGAVGRRHRRSVHRSRAMFRAEENVIVGNTVLYGATAGRAFFRGLAGERFAVRNSGALAVVEGVGDHGCEYMTGGRVVVLGPTGRNFAAGHERRNRLRARRSAIRRAVQHSSLSISSRSPRPTTEELKALIGEHAHRTGSLVARNLLSQWGRGARERFIKVMPRDYRRALAEQATAGQGGVDAAIRWGCADGRAEGVPADRARRLRQARP